MTPDLMRAIPLAIIGLTTACFALAMAVRAYRRSGVHWPPSWYALMAVYLGSLAVIALTAAFRRIGSDFNGHGHSLVTVLLWVGAAMSVWSFAHWVRSDEDGER